MGKAKLQRLLGQLESVQLADRQNAATIYTAATLAVQKLEEQTATTQPVAALPEAAPTDLSTFKQQFANHRACRQWLKMQGVHFTKTPSWKDLYQGWRYWLAIQPALAATLTSHPLPSSARFEITPQLARQQPE
ncbi:hypothetical protein [Synechococcus elongatus]|uniref:Uncharacterized protein n=1 Tax=Synechococcus elongatus PCC 11801 TaxID=2219813 RepID=A0AAN1QQ82_SYNEL|nr:hypothetical protein [Synechococcus elongatus]AZB73349.1 hypothetical protein DOP62_12080 [Synechococcus elongatus PCC 11801]